MAAEKTTEPTQTSAEEVSAVIPEPEANLADYVEIVPAYASYRDDPTINQHPPLTVDSPWLDLKSSPMDLDFDSLENS